MDMSSRGGRRPTWRSHEIPHPPFAKGGMGIWGLLRRGTCPEQVTVHPWTSSGRTVTGRRAPRNNNNPDNRNNNIGFRCVASPQHSLMRSKKLQTGILVFKEIKSVPEGSPDQSPGLAVALSCGRPKSAAPSPSLVIRLRQRLR